MVKDNEPESVRVARDLLRARLELGRRALVDGDREAFARYFEQAGEAVTMLGEALEAAYPPPIYTRRR